VIQSVRSTRFPCLPVHVRLGNLQYPGFEFDLDALVDTGFDGGLTVPQGLIPATALPLGDLTCNLADGSSMTAFSYLGFVSVGSLSDAFASDAARQSGDEPIQALLPVWQTSTPGGIAAQAASAGRWEAHNRRLPPFVHAIC